MITAGLVIVAVLVVVEWTDRLLRRWQHSAVGSGVDAVGRVDQTDRGAYL